MTHTEATRRFYAYFWPHRAMLLRTASFLTPSVSEAEELVQETLMKAFRAVDTFDERSSATAWLTAILRNTRIDQVRAAGRSLATVSLDETEMEVVAAPGGATAAASERPGDAAATLEEFSDRAVIRALKQLPEEIRWTLLLVDVDGLDYQQAAGVLQIPEGTVKSRLHRGRVMLRDALLLENPGMASARGAS